MSIRDPISKVRKDMPANTLGRVTIDGRNPRKMTFKQFLDSCPYKTIEHGQNDGPELKTCGYFEIFYHYTVNGNEYQYHVCYKYNYDETTPKNRYVYPTKQTSDYVGGVTYSGNDRIIS